MSNRSHPIRQLLDVVAMGHVPHPDELDELGLSAAVRRDLDAIVIRVRNARDDGDAAEARRIVREESDDLLSAAPQAHRWEPAETDPSKLAALIRR
jgi:hypothetical protein